MKWTACVGALSLVAACTVTAPHQPSPGDESLVPSDAPVYEKSLRGLTRGEMDLSDFWIELPAEQRNAPIPLHHRVYVDAAARVKDGVVNIYTRNIVERELKLGFELENLLPFRLPIVSTLLSYIPFQVPVPFRDEAFALGSGFVVNGHGFILTNAHVIRNATDIQVVFADGREAVAKIVGADAVTDSALIQVNAEEGPLSPLAFGNSTALDPGEIVLAVGNPLGLSHSVTSGLVSATERTVPGATELVDFVQTDSAINPGNSGGPLVNLRGEVVGMNTAILNDSQGIGFAVPIDTIKSMIPLLLMGKFERGWLGLQVEPKRDGAPVIGAIEEGSPGEKLGLEVGDRIVEVNGEATPGIVPLRRLALALIVGDPLRIVIERDGARKTFDAVLEARPR